MNEQKNPSRRILEPGQTKPKSVVVLYVPQTTAIVKDNRVRVSVDYAAVISIKKI